MRKHGCIYRPEHGLQLKSATQTLTLPLRLPAAPIKVLGMSAVMRHPHLPYPAMACDPNPYTTTRRLPAAPIKVLGKGDVSGTNVWLTSYLQISGSSAISANASVLWPACVQHVAATSGMRSALKSSYALGCARKRRSALDVGSGFHQPLAEELRVPAAVVSWAPCSLPALRGADVRRAYTDPICAEQWQASSLNIPARQDTKCRGSGAPPFDIV